MTTAILWITFACVLAGFILGASYLWSYLDRESRQQHMDHVALMRAAKIAAEREQADREYAAWRAGVRANKRSRTHVGTVNGRKPYRPS